ncbi:MAG: hypothetical protein WDM86_05415 [Rhizomicrobium sp.]
MNLYIFLPALAVIAAILLLSRRLPRRVLMVLGLVFVVAGAGALAALELWYSPARTQPFAMRLSLDAAGATVASRPFTLGLSGPYNLLLQLDRGDGVLAFGCLTAEPGFEALCPGREPELDVSWTVSEAGTLIARGGGGLARWKARRAALDPKAAAAKLAAFHAYADHAQEPSDQTPLYHDLGTFRGEAGRGYEIEFRVGRAAPTLAKLHPRVIVGLDTAVTRSAGPTFLGLALLCLGGGAFMLLLSFSRPKTAP